MNGISWMGEKHDSSCIIRNYQAKDSEAVIRFKDRLKTLLTTRSATDPQDLEEAFLPSNRLPEANVFVAERGEEIRGFAKVRPELDIERTVLTLIVHPDSWEENLVVKLIERSMNRARQLGAKGMHVNIFRQSSALKKLLLTMGFKPLRRYLELKLNVSKVPLPQPAPEALRCRAFERGEEHLLAQTQNRAFAGTWGYSVNTLEDVLERTALPDFSPEDIILCFDGATLIGHCWTRVAHRGSGPCEARGRIFMLGVDRDYRARGVGRHLLLAGLLHLKAQGIQEVELTVDSQNKAALVLYKSVGFKPEASSLWLAKSLV
jgi:mycothiol synthase